MSRFVLTLHVETADDGCPAGRSPASVIRRKHGQPGNTLVFVLAILIFAPRLSASDCIPVHEASQHVGEAKCVEGKVLKIRMGDNGVHFLDFCEDQMACSFVVVVFPSALRDVGDIRRLAGHTLEIHGLIKLYDGRAEIVLNRISQINGGAAMIPPLPKNYDVENRGHFSAGHLHAGKKPAKTKAKPSSTATYGNDVEGEEPPD
jgi:hypothetical protein